jgi:hypothetical protein
VSRSAIGETVFRLSVAPPDIPGFPKLVTLSEREREGVGNFARRFADIATTLSSKTSIHPGNYQWWPVRHRGGLRQDSCVYCVVFGGDYLRIIGVSYLRGGHGAAVVNWGRAMVSRV